MSTIHPKSRRQFLRNTALVTLAASALPGINLSAAAKKDTNSCDPTTQDYYGEGPYYRTSPPDMVGNKLAADSEPGTRLTVSGVVRTLDCSLIIPNAKIDVWHANNAGDYDMAGYTLRGVTYSNAQGFYLFDTIYPGKYALDVNKTVFRPVHIHFKITATGFPTLTTQLYFEGDPDNATDAAASIRSGTLDATHRIIPLTTNGSKKEGTWDIVVNGNGTTGINDLHLTRGMIYSVTPNPFSGEVEIFYGVFKPVKVCIQIFNMAGALVATLDEQNLTPEKYRATWTPPSFLPAGHYFIALKLNDLQVHYVKVMKM